MRSPLRVVLIVAALIVAAVVAITYAYRRDLDRAFEHISSGSVVVQTPCGPIEYATAGEDEPVLVVHGAGGGFDEGIGFANDLAASRPRVIAMSRFGYLRTPLPADASAAAQADAHACLLDAFGVRRAAIVGVSAGAPSSPSPSRSTPGRERLLTGEHRPRRSTRFYNRLTPVVLRRPLELKQYLSIRYTDRLATAGIEASVGSTGDSYDDALAESVIGLYKTEVIRRQGPWRGVDDVELATLTGLAWYNAARLLEPLGYVPPAEFEQAFYDRQDEAAQLAGLT